MKLAVLSLALVAVYGSIPLDDFSTGGVPSGGLEITGGDPAGGPYSIAGYQPGTMIGNERDVEIFAQARDVQNAFADAKVTVGGTCSGSSDNNVFASWEYQWDGIDGSMNVNDGGILINTAQVCPSGANVPFLRIFVAATDQCHNQEVFIYTRGGDGSVLKRVRFFELQGQCFGTPSNNNPGINMDYALSEFGGIDPNSITGVTVFVDALVDDPIEALDYVWDTIALCCCTTDAQCDDGNPTTQDQCIDECTCGNVVDTDPPTSPPTDPPTDAPTAAPTDQPTDPPTDSPTEAPTENACNIGICEEDVKTPICYPDEDGHLNRICVYIDDLDSYLDNGGFNPDDRVGVDCDCEYLFAPTESPTDAPPVITNPPTEEPTDPPTDPPTDAPTQAPTDPPTEIRSSTIGDVIFVDTNANGVPDDGEPGVFGLVVTLVEDTNGNAAVDVGEPQIDVDITNINGGYLFPNLPAGDYIVVLEDPDNLLDGMNPTSFIFDIVNPGSDLEIVFGPDVVGSSAVSVAADEDYLDIDFGFIESVDPPEVCLDVVPDEPSKNFRCIMDSNFNVDMAIVDLTDTDTLDEYYAYFPLGSFYDQLDVGENIWWDCWCHAHCPWESEHAHMFVPEFLVDQSYFYDDILHLVVAIPNRYDMGTDFYFQDTHGVALGPGSCNTNSIQSCNEWTRADTDNGTDAFFRHNCYTVYYSDVPLSSLTAHYKTHEDGDSSDPGAWMVTYYGLLVSESGVNLGTDIRGDDDTFTQRSNYKWAITFPLQVEAHVEDIRVYDEVNKVDNVIAAAVHVEDFSWGFSWGMYAIWGEASIRTSVQWPFRLELDTVTVRDRDLDLAVFFENVDNSGCVDPGIADYGNPAWIASADANQADGGSYVPEECIQIWSLRIEILRDGVCNLEDYYDMGFNVVCQQTYADNCPLDERYSDPLMCEFWLSTENFCDMFEDTVTVTAELDSYECEERECVCEQNNFIETFVNQNGDIATETVYYELFVDSTEPLEATEVRSVETDVICEQPPVNVMREVYNRFWPGDGWIADLEGLVNNSPDTTNQCLGGNSASTVNFQFDLPPDFFGVPYDDSCELRVWVVVDLWYRGVARPDNLQPGGKKMLLETSDNEVFSFGESRSVTLTHTILLTGNLEVDGKEQVEGATERGSASHLTPTLSLLLLVAYILG